MVGNLSGGTLRSESVVRSIRDQLGACSLQKFHAQKVYKFSPERSFKYVGHKFTGILFLFSILLSVFALLKRTQSNRNGR